jgi:hypothetical protein
VASIVMMLALAYALRIELSGFEVGRTLRALGAMAIGAVAFGGASYGAWWMLDDGLGRSLPGQLVSVSVGLGAGFLVYAGIVLLLRVPEAEVLARLVRGRLRRFS